MSPRRLFVASSALEQRDTARRRGGGGETQRRFRLNCALFVASTLSAGRRYPQVMDLFGE